MSWLCSGSCPVALRAQQSAAGSCFVPPHQQKTFSLRHGLYKAAAASNDAFSYTIWGTPGYSPPPLNLFLLFWKCQTALHQTEPTARLYFLACLPGFLQELKSLCTSQKHYQKFPV